MAAKVLRFTQSQQNPVGMIVQSMLTEAQFQALNGPSWVLMDGRNVAGSVYAQITGQNVIADARGLFLRAKNNGRSDGNQNPDGDLALGTLQLDHTRRPRDTAFATNTDTHSHSATVYVGGPTGDVGRFSSFSAGGTSFNNTASTNTDAHSHSITSGGDAETNPRNLTVNTFIKINP